MINFKQFFEERKRNDALYRIDNQSCLDFYCGFDETLKRAYFNLPYGKVNNRSCPSG